MKRQAAFEAKQVGGLVLFVLAFIAAAMVLDAGRTMVRRAMCVTDSECVAAYGVELDGRAVR